jgi:predicted membrane protein
MRQYGNQNRVVLGAIIVVFGVLALIDSLRLFGDVDIVTFWPSILILAGVLKLSQTRNRHGNVVGGVLIALGLVLTLDHLGIFYFHLRNWWPLLLIGAGVLVLSRGLSEQESGWRVKGGGIVPGSDGLDSAGAANIGAADPATRSYLNVVAVMSGSKSRNDSQDFRGGEITAVMGGTEIDLRQAGMVTDATIHIFAMWGGIVLKIPADWTVVSNAMPILGGIEDHSVPPTAPGKRLIIEGYVVMGGVEFKN